MTSKTLAGLGIVALALAGCGGAVSSDIEQAPVGNERGVPGAAPPNDKPPGPADPTSADSGFPLFLAAQIGEDTNLTIYRIDDLDGDGDGDDTDELTVFWTQESASAFRDMIVGPRGELYTASWDSVRRIMDEDGDGVGDNIDEVRIGLCAYCLGAQSLAMRADGALDVAVGNVQTGLQISSVAFEEGVGGGSLWRAPEASMFADVRSWIAPAANGALFIANSDDGRIYLKSGDSLDLYYEPDEQRAVEVFYDFPENHGPIHYFGATGRLATGTWDGFVLEDLDDDGRVYGPDEVALQVFGGSCVGVQGVGVVQTADRFIWVENCGMGLVQSTTIDGEPGGADVVLTSLPDENVQAWDVVRLAGPPPL